jgi:hypothetical protein
LLLNNNFTFVRGKSKATNTVWLLLSKRVTKNALLLLLTVVPTTCVSSPSRMKILLLSRTTRRTMQETQKTKTSTTARKKPPTQMNSLKLFKSHLRQWTGISRWNSCEDESLTDSEKEAADSNE